MAKTSSKLLIAAIILVILALISLGNWQLRRLDWKLDLIERVETRAYAEPVSAPLPISKNQITAEEHEYLHVMVLGSFLHDKETLVWAATEYGNGYWVLTPLVTPEEQTILINRGFVPMDKIEQQTRTAGLPTGSLEITGLLRVTEPEGTLLRANEPSQNRWYSRDVEMIAEARGLSNVAPYFIDAAASTNPDEMPIGGLTRLNFNNPHLLYAITWYGLALLLVVLTIYALRSDWAASDSEGD